jgi:transposase
MGAPAYHPKIREELIARMQAGEPRKLLHRETGIPLGTLGRWMQTPPAILEVMPKSSTPPPESPKTIRSTRQWSVAEKLRILELATATMDSELGELIRREGVHEADLKLWRSELGEVLAARTSAARAAEKKLHAVEAELREVRALLELQKKVDAVYGREAAAVSPAKKSDD